MSVSYIIREGVAGISRARMATITAITALTLSILLVGVLGRVAYNAYMVAQSMRGMVEVEVFLKELDPNETAFVKKRLTSLKMTSTITYVSKDSAAAVFKREFGEEGAALADLQFLPASFKLEIREDFPLDSIVTKIEAIRKMDGIDDVTFNQQLLELLESRINTVVLIGGALGLFIMLVSLFLVYNTIRLTIFVRKKLIKAMKLVGATNAFIRWPFIVEGLIQGSISWVLSLGLLLLVFNVVLPAWVPQLTFFVWPWENPFYLIMIMLVLSLGMGWLGSNLAARRYIKETSVG